jgi:hypothetical protein
MATVQPTLNLEPSAAHKTVVGEDGTHRQEMLQTRVEEVEVTNATRI